MTSVQLRYGSDEEPGLRRLGRSRFRYVHVDGRPASAQDVVRIRSLAIPPAWTNVWIAPSADWHIQATGRDAKGRKQYRYHDDFREEREAAKFNDLRQFGLDLVGLRRAVAVDLGDDGLTHDRLVATIVRLLDRTALRIGNEQYAKANGSFGLTTLRNEHARGGVKRVRLQVRGKSAHEFDVTVEDPKVAKVVRTCQHLPGQLLFQYEDDDGGLRPVTSGDVNEYLQRHSCATATAKTFRTWTASVLGASLLAEAERPATVTQTRREVNAAVRQVAAHLGNTLAVCKRSYVHPVVYETFESGELAARWQEATPTRPGGLTGDERRFWKLIDDHSE
jgi:DNA topoisomerase-1